jgi:mannose-1-phosphate guanylyltransferase / mannose-6-phosphate isomerase
MSIHPVIMCGGSGVRLWPESRPSRPKQFLPLVAERSLFQRTAERMAPLADDGRLLVVTGARHLAAAREQLSGIGISATFLVEPEARESAPAAAAAAVWIAGLAPDGVAAIVASDHHIEDDHAFRDAIRTAAEAAADDVIVTLGVRPTHPSEAYGYIRPDTVGGLSRVAEFREKPDRQTAAAYIRADYLWNSGNFIVSARRLIDELALHAPDILDGCRRAVAEAGDPVDDVVWLGPAFGDAPKRSLDYAVMEKTDRASVLPVDFVWSDLGAWDAVAAAGGDRRGLVVAERVEDCVIRAAPGMVVAAMGLSNVAVIVERDAVLVCPLDQAQEVKALVERVRLTSPSHADFAEGAPSGGLAENATRLAQWLGISALPLWGTVGVNPDGSFRETIDRRGRASDAPRRSRVQTRQAWVYCRAGAHGWNGPWTSLALRGLEAFDRDFRRGDGAYRSLVGADGGTDDTAMLYDQAFALLAASEMHRLDPGQATAMADRILTGLSARRHSAGGWREAGAHPFQANAHMHLLEAAMAWEAAGDDRFTAMADEIVGLALNRFIDPDSGRLREFFAEDWSPARGTDGRLVEPGHQFEWASLLTRYGVDRSSAEVLDAGRTLYALGRAGVDRSRNVAIDELDVSGEVRSARARLWPQTERLKAALLLAGRSEGAERAALVRDATAALQGLWLYLEPSGTWRDKLLDDGAFADEPAPASSLYHIMAAFDQLTESRAVAGLDDASSLELG